MKLLQIILVFIFAERKFLRHKQRNTYLVSVQTGVRGNDRTSSEIDSLPHHLHAEKTLLLLQDLPDSFEVLVLYTTRFARINEAIDTVLQLKPLVYEVTLSFETPKSVCIEMGFLKFHHFGLSEVLGNLKAISIELSVLLIKLLD